MPFLKFLYLFLLTTANLCAATYYVDYDAVDDSANGTTTGTPFKRCPGDPAATGVAAATALAPGDSVLFRKGVTYVPSLGSIQGKAGVTYDGGAWGTGANAILSGQYTTSTCFYFVENLTNWTVKRMTITLFGGYAEDDPYYSPKATIASVDTATDIIETVAQHNLSVGWSIGMSLPSGGSYPAPIFSGVGDKNKRYVKTIPTPTSFTLGASTSSATLLDLTSTGSGTIYVWRKDDGRDGYGIIAKKNNLGFLIEDVNFDSIGQWRPVFPADGDVKGSGIAIDNSKNFIIRRCDFTKMRHAIGIGCDGVNSEIDGGLVEDCVIHDYINWGIDIAASRDGDIIENILINRCTIKNMHQYDKGNWAGFGEKPHTDGIFLRNYGLKSSWSNIHINACQFYADYVGASWGGTANIFCSGGPDMMVTNCLFGNNAYPTHISIGGGRTVRATGEKQIIRIYNNTFARGTLCIILSGTVDPTLRETYIQNNIFLRDANSSSPMYYTEYQDGYLNVGWPVPPAVANNNVYWSDAWTINQKDVWAGGGYKTFPELQAEGVYEQNGAYGNPLFGNLGGNFATWDMTLPSGSSAIGIGANLSAYFTTDILGNARPASGAWDAGAYVSSYSPPADVTAPTLVSWTISSTGLQCTLEFDESVTGVVASDYAIAGHTLSGASGSGTTWNLSISPAIQVAQTVTGGYTAGTTEDIALNNLANFSGFAITNNSLEPTPDPANAPFRGRGKRVPAGR